MNTETELQKPIQSLSCNCCGGYLKGRQWHNRDTGYGMCTDCIAYVRKRGMAEAEIENLYGVGGIHWGRELWSGKAGAA